MFSDARPNGQIGDVFSEPGNTSGTPRTTEAAAGQAAGLARANAQQTVPSEVAASFAQNDGGMSSTTAEDTRTSCRPRLQRIHTGDIVHDYRGGEPTSFAVVAEAEPLGALTPAEETVLQLSELVQTVLDKNAAVISGKSPAVSSVEELNLSEEVLEHFRTGGGASSGAGQGVAMSDEAILKEIRERVLEEIPIEEMHAVVDGVAALFLVPEESGPRLKTLTADQIRKMKEMLRRGSLALSAARLEAFPDDEHGIFLEEDSASDHEGEEPFSLSDLRRLELWAGLAHLAIQERVLGEYGLFKNAIGEAVEQAVVADGAAPPPGALREEEDVVTQWCTANLSLDDPASLPPLARLFSVRSLQIRRGDGPPTPLGQGRRQNLKKWEVLPLRNAIYAVTKRECTHGKSSMIHANTETLSPSLLPPHLSPPPIPSSLHFPPTSSPPPPPLPCLPP